MAPVVRSQLPSSHLKLPILSSGKHILTALLSSLMADSGLVVVLCVVTLLLVVVFIPLLAVEYQWCHVLFDNTTVSTLSQSYQSLYRAQNLLNIFHNSSSIYNFRIWRPINGRLKSSLKLPTTQNILGESSVYEKQPSGYKPSQGEFKVIQTF